MLKVFLLLCFILPLSAYSQNELDDYLQAHHYPFSLEQGFDPSASDSLQQKFAAYRVILQGEGGSHFLTFYRRLPLMWIRFLQQRFGLKEFFLEGGHSSEVLLNNYLAAGDSAFIFVKDKTFWKRIYELNSTLPKDRRLHYFGTDFESRVIYVKAMQLLLPENSPPAAIAPIIDLIRRAKDTVNECSYIMDLNKVLKKALAGNRQDFVQYFDNRFPDFERMVLNSGACNDRFNDRNKNMAVEFLSYDRQSRQTLYFGELGEAHTILKNKSTANYINENPQFRDKVAVINLYCYQCSTPEEKVSNWQLDGIEKDILQYLFPYCTTDFTLFDFSGNHPAIKRFAQYGQFLIIAKDQH